MSDRRKRETKLQGEIVCALRALGLITLRLNSGGVPTRRGWVTLQPAGTPDVFVQLRDGRAAWVEVKVDDGRSSEEQRDFARRARLHNAVHVEARSVDEALVGLGIIRGAEDQRAPSAEMLSRKKTQHRATAKEIGTHSKQPETDKGGPL